MLRIKALHVVFMVTWFAGLFCLPRLFAYHAMAADTMSKERFNARLVLLVQRGACHISLRRGHSDRRQAALGELAGSESATLGMLVTRGCAI